MPSFYDETPLQINDTKKIEGKLYIYTGKGWLIWENIKSACDELHVALVESMSHGKNVDSIVNLIKKYPDVALPAFFEACEWQVCESERLGVRGPTIIINAEPCEVWAGYVMDGLSPNMIETLNEWACEKLAS